MISILWRAFTSCSLNPFEIHIVLLKWVNFKKKSFLRDYLKEKFSKFAPPPLGQFLNGSVDGDDLVEMSPYFYNRYNCLDVNLLLHSYLIKSEINSSEKLLSFLPKLEMVNSCLKIYFRVTTNVKYKKLILSFLSIQKSAIKLANS